MTTLARWCFGHRRVVLAGWLLALLVIGATGHMAGSTPKNSASLPHTDSTAALSLLQANFPTESGDVDHIVLEATSGSVRDPAVAGPAEAMLARVAHLPHVARVASPYGPTGAMQISPDGKVAFATVTLDEQANVVPKAAVQRIMRTAQAADRPRLSVSLGGAAIENAQGFQSSSSEAIGVAFALVVLLVAFGSLFAALMPLLSALIAIGIGTSLIALLTHVMGVATFANELAILIGLGVGIDYALFIISRHRRHLQQGMDIQEAAARAVNTSGRAVFFAGVTVCIALLGQFAIGMSFLYGAAVAAAITVALTVATSLTLLPAMLGFLGPKALSRRERRRLALQGPVGEEASGFWFRWSVLLQRRSLLVGAVGLLIVTVVGIPFFSMRLGLSDAGNDPAGQTTRDAYNTLARGFGPGFNGPFQVVGELRSPGDLAAFDHLLAELPAQPDVAAVTPPRVSPNGRAVVALAYPRSAPQDKASADLLHHLRTDVVPRAEAGSTLSVHLGGTTALADDFSTALARKLPLFIAVVVALAFVLLVLVFRSLLIPLTASVMNLLSVGAGFGLLTAVFQWGWAAGPLGLSRTGPVDVYVPVIMFSVLFGLSMDYQVFLVSRMHEEWIRRRDNSLAVTIGQAATGRVITAAAAIMMLVFGSFLIGGSRVIDEFGVGLGGAVLVDAFVVRTLLVPSIMHRLGRANWWLPSWLDRRLPRLAIEDGAQQPEQAWPTTPPVEVSCPIGAAERPRR